MCLVPEQPIHPLPHHLDWFHILLEVEELLGVSVNMIEVMEMMEMMEVMEVMEMMEVMGEKEVTEVMVPWEACLTHRFHRKIPKSAQKCKKRPFCTFFILIQYILFMGASPSLEKWGFFNPNLGGALKKTGVLGVPIPPTKSL